MFFKFMFSGSRTMYQVKRMNDRHGLSWRYDVRKLWLLALIWIHWRYPFERHARMEAAISQISPSQGARYTIQHFLLTFPTQIVSSGNFPVRSPGVWVLFNIVRWHVGHACTLKDACVSAGNQPLVPTASRKTFQSWPFARHFLAKWDSLSELGRLAGPINTSDDWDLLNPGSPS